MIKIVEKIGAIEFQIRVIARALKTEIVGEMDGAVRVRVSSPPVDGAANTELVKLFAKTLGVAKSKVVLVSGLSCKTKRIRVTGVTAEAVQDALG